MKVRKPKDGREDETTTPLSACPLSGNLIPVTALECPTTKDPLPMCVVTGQHVTLADIYLCPRIGMPALFSHYLKHIEDELKATAATNQDAGLTESAVALDPVTESPVEARELIRLSEEEAAAYIAKHNMDKEDPPPPKPKSFAM